MAWVTGLSVLKTRTVLGKLEWMVIALRAVHPHRRALTQLRQVLQWVMEPSSG